MTDQGFTDEDSLHNIVQLSNVLPQAEAGSLDGSSLL